MKPPDFSMSTHVSDLSEAPCRPKKSTAGGPALSQLRVALRLRSVGTAGGATVLTPEKHSLGGEVLSRRVKFSGHETAGGL